MNIKKERRKYTPEFVWKWGVPQKEHLSLPPIKNWIMILEYKFRVEFLDEASDFLESLDEKAKEKILYNIWKARMVKAKDKELFKKLQDEIWEFRTLYNSTY